MRAEQHSHGEKAQRTNRRVVVDLVTNGDQVTAYVKDGYQGAPLWHHTFSLPPSKEQLSELAYGAGQCGFDPKLVLVPLGKFEKARRR